MNETTYQVKTRRDHPALLDAAAFRASIRDAFIKLAPRHIVKSPVMAIVLLGTILAALITLAGQAPAGFGWSVTAILFVTVLFGNFAEAVAEARGEVFDGEVPASTLIVVKSLFHPDFLVEIEGVAVV